MFASMAMASAHFGAQRYTECVTWARIMIEANPEHIGGYTSLAAALAMQGELTAAAETRDALLRLRPELSLSWMKENLPPTDEFGERLRDGWRKAGIPEA